MKRRVIVLKKVAVIKILLFAILLVASCRKNAGVSSMPQSNSASPASNATKIAATSNVSLMPSVDVNLTGLKSDDGYAYKIGVPLDVIGDSNEQPDTSTMQLFEDGVRIGPAHSDHADIRSLGSGRFSHWGNTLIFSASDNSNPATNGRKYTYMMGGSANTQTKMCASTTGISTALMGYAMVNGTTTGGNGGQTITVSTLADLKTAVTGSTPKIIYVSGTITGAGLDPVRVGSNTTIIGKPGAVLQGMNLYLFTVSNVIIQNITFKNYITECGVYVKFQSHHVWIDHCDFSTDRNHGWDYWGKDVGVAEGSDYVTISWCKFHDTNLSLLIGSVTSDAVVANTGKLHVTLHHNYWYNVSEREPTLVFGSVHMYNNYHVNNGGYSIGARYGGTVRTDNEYFSGCKKPLTTNLDADPVGYFSGVNTNVYSNCGSNDITTPTSTWVPGYSYSPDAAVNVPDIVANGAGAILTN